ncbi:alpha/beta hydrolase family protein [Methylobacterium sp. NPDC080182]|uniref:alpha/beta hydrolase family protein n=1 Tax=Methylobacterium sp. NPDC080182 TaxID=3390590 RepID=UPI003CFDB141
MKANAFLRLLVGWLYLTMLNPGPGHADETHFTAHDVLNGVAPGDCQGSNYIRVALDGREDCLRFYGAQAEPTNRPPLVFLEGDVISVAQPRTYPPAWQVGEFYRRLNPKLMQKEADLYSAATARTFVNLARPGTFGSSGHHLERRRPREVALVNAALDALKARFGWAQINLAGFSGGGHLVGALLARRDDIGCAVIASGNVAVRQRGVERGLSADVTGYEDFVDPIEHAAEIGRRPPMRVVILTDPADRIVEAKFQNMFAVALRTAGVAVEQRLVAAADPDHHNLRSAAIIAGLACADR